MELLNVRFTFITKFSVKNKEGLSPILLRVIYRGERKDIYTDLCGSSACPAVKMNLQIIEHKAMHAFDELQHAGVPFTIHDLVAKIKGKEEAPQIIYKRLRSANRAKIQNK